MARTVRKILEIVARFMRRCRSKGWRVIEREDIIKKNDEFHNILWTRKIHPSTFKSVAAKETCAIQEDMAYHTIDVTYNAWISAAPLSEPLKQTIAKNPEILKRNAVYDLSREEVTEKLNKTGSEVFQEFERFLKDEFQCKLKPIRIQEKL